MIGFLNLAKLWSAFLRLDICQWHEEAKQKVLLLVPTKSK